MNEPNIIQEIMADFSATGTINVELQSPPYADASFGSVYIVEGDNRVLYATTATWNSQPQLVSRKGFIYIYSDWTIDEEGRTIAGTKIGDGDAYLIDIPFTDGMWFNHVNDAVIHITPEEREKWNNKVRCYISDNSTNLIFTTN